MLLLGVLVLPFLPIIPFGQSIAERMLYLNQTLD